MKEATTAGQYGQLTESKRTDFWANHFTNETVIHVIFKQKGAFLIVLCFPQQPITSGLTGYIGRILVASLLLGRRQAKLRQHVEVLRQTGTVILIVVAQQENDDVASLLGLTLKAVMKHLGDIEGVVVQVVGDLVDIEVDEDPFAALQLNEGLVL